VQSGFIVSQQKDNSGDKRNISNDVTIVHPSDSAQELESEITTHLIPSDTTTEVITPAELGSGESQDLLPGTIIKDRFVVQGLLGRGGMGVVYRVKDLRKEETNDRDPYLAMKVLNESYRLDQRMAIAMQREARKAQTLAHPNISTGWTVGLPNHGATQRRSAG